jgi:hypothetical protein
VNSNKLQRRRRHWLEIDVVGTGAGVSAEVDEDRLPIFHDLGAQEVGPMRPPRIGYLL